jgi:hypothetical protein
MALIHAHHFRSNESYGWHFQYLTIIGLMLATLTFTAGALADLTLSPRLFHIKNLLSMCSAPLECLISTLYWGLRAIDPKLVVPEELELDFMPGMCPTSYSHAVFELGTPTFPSRAPPNHSIISSNLPHRRRLPHDTFAPPCSGHSLPLSPLDHHPHPCHRPQRRHRFCILDLDRTLLSEQRMVRLTRFLFI